MFKWIKRLESLGKAHMDSDRKGVKGILASSGDVYDHHRREKERNGKQNIRRPRK